mmetsp:Transcript_14739/g.44518  ORF Transcript_14739/g.44518 Transcript_14739/m.44518 type:complete len:279 (+) Transcript_14739:360-1196(+)|eukprot:CAMPEP_0206140972 /NCGR_PEP_ID=MMETSP1473-20131121/11414_1 /ASSEMBLY_ACC=CAM_ASM_001109 /TAXON_ID=1461547 /ORGANISM="Stichococcus sp, Strain RCC1054" /LENGTH=278 /DNA_ID=CAMNT_0053535349 /DNA_START=309 /DNA_END=1145 /DNA_ORIENTATION=-
MMTGADIQALKAYVQASDGGMQNRDASTVLLQVSHSNLAARFMEIRLDQHITVEALKIKLTSHCGTAANSMELQLKDERGRLLATLDDGRMLGYYSPHDGCIIHIIDTDPHSLSANGWLEDVSKVQKYEMSDEDYAQRENTYRKFKEQKLKDDPTWTLEKEMAAKRGVPYAPPEARSKVEAEDHQQEDASAVSVGSRCEVSPGGKRGTVRYVGKCEDLPLGWWVGVEYDEPVGKNDGSIKGRRYFTAKQGYGGMVRPANVAVGDFPEEDFQFSDGDEI